MKNSPWLTWLLVVVTYFACTAAFPQAMQWVDALLVGFGLCFVSDVIHVVRSPQ